MIKRDGMVSLRLPENEKAKMKTIADFYDIPLSQVILNLCRKGLENINFTENQPKIKNQILLK